MLSSGSSPLTVKRGNTWRLLMVAGAVWLAIGWTMLRLEPANVAAVAGPVVLFGALCEAVRALAGTRTWWLNAGLAAVFTVTAGLLLTLPFWSFATASALVGWYLMVRGVTDVAVGVMARGTDRVWSLLVLVGVLETGLGFFAASPFSRTARLVMVVLGALGVLRAVAELVTALRLREVAGPRRDVLRFPAESSAGLRGYAAGVSDVEDAPRWRARHRARPSASTVAAGVAGGRSGEGFPDRAVRTTADLDAFLTEAGVTGSRAGAVPDAPEGVEAAPEAR
ncbi:hypothetical protein KZ829_09900 [Actinoplanes hulinensis]|uniref:DUF308 domain-containing protein n=1 Tax=Actinoplanes hulinensis TaxID=1144547 RepID=A0ABS7AZD6_9ACTN|nr:hypothetical protein [Actinoplanes hulinensis]MBW6434047.1 hypothetical protein [Actinoplanes hulinensis]